MDKFTKRSFVKSIDPETKTISGYISTFSWDRDMERFVKGAWDLSAYLKNPVVLWSHDLSQPPIGRNIALEEDEFGLLATTEFDSKSDFAMQILSLFERKFLNAFSVGFLRKNYVLEDAGNGTKGLAITEAELYEYSPVSVPANPGAIVGREIAELAMKALGSNSIEALKTKTMGEQFLVVPEDAQKGPEEPETPPTPDPEKPIETPAGQENEPETAPQTTEQAPENLEPALKQVIELARMAKGNPVSEKQRVLLTTAIGVFNEIVEDHKEDLSNAELSEIKRVLIEFAGVTAQIYPDAANIITKTISQIEKAVTGKAA